MFCEPHTCSENGKLFIHIYIYIYIFMFICMVRAYSIYTSCPICEWCNIFTLHIGLCIDSVTLLSMIHEATLAQETRQAGQKGWTVGVMQQGLENGDEREARLVRRRLIINSVFHDSAANGECSVFKTISLWEPEPERPARLEQITLAEQQLEKSFWNSVPNLQ